MAAEYFKSNENKFIQYLHILPFPLDFMSTSDSAIGRKMTQLMVFQRSACIFVK
jgi:hypothetical protein